MNIAIPTNDMLTISAHFGRSKGFLIFEIQDNRVSNLQYKLNNFTGHAKNKDKEEDHGKHEHSHDTIMKVLGNCKAVIAGGMGKRLFTDFEAQDIQVFISEESSIVKAVDLYLNGVLDNNASKCCDH